MASCACIFRVSFANLFYNWVATVSMAMCQVNRDHLASQVHFAIRHPPSDARRNKPGYQSCLASGIPVFRGNFASLFHNWNTSCSMTMPQVNRDHLSNQVHFALRNPSDARQNKPGYQSCLASCRCIFRVSLANLFYNWITT